MRSILRLVATAVVITLVASVGWLAFSTVNTSATTNFQESIRMVSHQTMRMDTSLQQTSSVVITDVSTITGIHQLLEVWTPRYEQAVLAYAKFDAAIIAAEQQADAYFIEQTALTAKYNDPVLRAKRQVNDEMEYHRFGTWRDSAHQVRSNARRVLDRLEDMDTDLHKLKLTTEMSSAFNVSGFDDVPLEITALGAELSEFQVASENIRAMTASPFMEAPIMGDVRETATLGVRVLFFVLALGILAGFWLPWVRIDGFREGSTGIQLMVLVVTPSWDYLMMVSPVSAGCLIGGAVGILAFGLRTIVQYVRRRTAIISTTAVLVIAGGLPHVVSGFLPHGEAHYQWGLQLIIATACLLLAQQLLIRLTSKLRTMRKASGLYRSLAIATGSGHYRWSDR